MKIKFKRKKGFSLIELILVMALLAIGVLASVNVVKFTADSQKMSSTEYDLQSQVRVVSQTLNNNIRFSSALFALPKLAIDGSANGWNYITTTNLDEEGYGDAIIDYEYDPVNQSYKERIIVDEQKDIKYKLEFHKYNDYSEDKLIEFYIVIKNTKTGVERDLKAEVEGLNSLQIVDRGRTLGAKSKVLYYRKDDRPLAAEAAVTFVMDNSGSMQANMYGDYRDGNGNGIPYEERRMGILKKQTRNLIDLFSENDFIYMNLVPFSNTANNPNMESRNRNYPANAYIDFLNVSFEKDKLLEDINELDRSSGTNTGDGMRRGYHNLLDHNRDSRINKPEVEVSNYFLLLVDGRTNRFPVNSNPTGDRDFLFDGDLVINPDNYYELKGGQVVRSGSTSREYIRRLGDIMVNQTKMNRINSYVIGFSAKPSELGDLEMLGDSINGRKSSSGSKYFEATNEQELEKIFKDISEDIKKDLWHIHGPY